MITGIAFLVICLVIFRQFSGIAFKFNKNRIGFGLLGIVFFSTSYFLIAFLTQLIMDAMNVYILKGLIAMLVLQLLLLGLSLAVTTIIGVLFKKVWAD